MRACVSAVHSEGSTLANVCHDSRSCPPALPLYFPSFKLRSVEQTTADRVSRNTADRNRRRANSDANMT